MADRGILRCSVIVVDDMMDCSSLGKGRLILRLKIRCLDSLPWV